jgi:hypothetical protein
MAGALQTSLLLASMHGFVYGLACCKVLGKALTAWCAFDLVNRSRLAMQMGWPDIHWLARDEGGLVAAVFEAIIEALPRVGSAVGA